jgi:hypothetical protein
MDKTEISKIFEGLSEYKAKKMKKLTAEQHLCNDVDYSNGLMICHFEITEDTTIEVLHNIADQITYEAKKSNIEITDSVFDFILDCAKHCEK